MPWDPRIHSDFYQVPNQMRHLFHVADWNNRIQDAFQTRFSEFLLINGKGTNPLTQEEVDYWAKEAYILFGVVLGDDRHEQETLRHKRIGEERALDEKNAADSFNWNAYHGFTKKGLEQNIKFKREARKERIRQEREKKIESLLERIRLIEEVLEKLLPLILGGIYFLGFFLLGDRVAGETGQVLALLLAAACLFLMWTLMELTSSRGGNLKFKIKFNIPNLLLVTGITFFSANWAGIIGAILGTAISGAILLLFLIISAATTPARNNSEVEVSSWLYKGALMIYFSLAGYYAADIVGAVLCLIAAIALLFVLSVVQKFI